MDIVQRLILAVLLLISSLAQAEDVLMTFRLESGPESNSRETACTSYHHPVDGPYRWNDGTCINISNPNRWGTVIMTSTCPSTATFLNNFRFDEPNNRYATCRYPTTCPQGEIRLPSGTCSKPPVTCTPGCNGVCGTEQPLTGRGTIACFNGCYYSLGDAFGLVVSNDNNGKPQKTWWTDVEDNTGTPCDAPEDEQPDGADDAPDKPDLPDPCPECECAKKGMTWGSYTTNGTTTVMCLKPGSPGGKPVDIAPKPTVKTETPAPTPENPNPEPTTTTTPSPVITITPGSGAGSQPTVTETTTNPDGSTTSTSEPQSNYCEKNPNAKVCKDAEKEEGKGTWGGGCGAWECEGDAANCAMSRKIHQDRCDDIEGMEQFADAAGRGQRILHGEEDEDVTAYLNREGDGNRTVNVGSLVSDSGPYSFGASCISDVQFSIGGHSVSVPFSKICPYLEMIGYFLLAASYLAALRIVGFI